MKKKDVINLIKFHIDDNEKEFRNVSYEIAKDFNKNGDEELSRYIMALLGGVNTFSPQYTEIKSNFFEKVSSPIKNFNIPECISKDLIGVLNAIKKNTGVNKFLFVGESGTGKTEAAKQIAKVLNRDLYSINFPNIVDSKLGQTSKNLINVFDDINSLKNPNQIIILFDELDSIALDRVNSNDLREMGRVTSTLLKEFDKLDPNIIIIATTNLYKELDKALIRRFDYVIDFNRYTNEDLKDIMCSLVENEISNYKYLKMDTRIVKKIFDLSNIKEYPGTLKNLIRTSVAFSNTEDEYDYLVKLYEKFLNKKFPDNINELSKEGFSLREIEKLTGKSKSSVQRGLKYE